MRNLPFIFPIFGIPLGLFLASRENPDLQFLTFFILSYSFLFACRFVITFIHEAGHVFFGAVVGFKLAFVQVWRVRYVHLRRGWRLSVRPSAYEVKGLAAMYPTHFRRIRWRLLCYYAGGSCFEAAAWGIVLYFLVSWFMHRPPLSLGSQVESAFLFGWATHSMFNLPRNLIPRDGKYLNDGKLIQALLRNGPLAKFLIQLNHLYAQNALGRRPRDVPDAELQIENDLTLPPNVVATLRIYQFYTAADRSDHAAAEQALHAMLNDKSQLPMESQHWVELLNAWFSITVLQDKARTEVALALIPAKWPDDTGLRAIVDAYRAHIKGDQAQARAALARGEASMGQFLESGAAPMFLDSAARLRQQLG